MPENNRWSTPQNLFDSLNEEFDFNLDVCAEQWNHKCSMYFSPDIDGLKQLWTGNVWMNPPYGREIKHWVQKAYEESQKVYCNHVVCLIPSRTETEWFQDYCLKGEVRFIRGRIHFTNFNGKSGRPRFGSALVIFRSNHVK
jgi:phage N-6-adenine-methyltransferase